ncbi:MAG: polysaccharide export protein, partial [Verrucomicrobia bacterium]|nr:polysaccharide export protein [Verrucomicrobiota bacterium]
FVALPVLALSAEKAPEPQTQESSKTNSVSLSSAPVDYQLRPLDLLDIRVFQEDDLSMTNKVSQAGTLTFPLIGTVKVSGLKVHEAEILVTDKLKDGYIKKPQVTILVKEYAARRVSVLGEVKKPGTVEIPPEEALTLLQAVAYAGGFQNVAKTDEVVVRRMIDGKETKTKVNATKLMRADAAECDYPLEPGDIVYVPTRFF